jgi:hypothetical protein
MSREVKSTDFGDDWINRFWDSIQELKCSIIGVVPGPIRQAADRFAALKPRPSPDAFRSHIDVAVDVARGWDHPHDHDLMLAAAAKSYLLIAWLDYLQEQSPGQPLDLQAATRVSFTPVFKDEPPIRPN